MCLYILSSYRVVILIPLFCVFTSFIPAGFFYPHTDKHLAILSNRTFDSEFCRVVMSYCVSLHSEFCRVVMSYCVSLHSEFCFVVMFTIVCTFIHLILSIYFVAIC